MAKVLLENVRVDFPIYGAQQRSLRTAIFQRATGGRIQREGKNHDRVLVRALTDVSMQLEEGDRLGLIGHNGSGKSTLLKVIAGIYEPIQGRLLVEGRVTPLFDMMPGLDVEDTGYENIFTAGLLLGLTRDEIENMIPEIEEFCELGEYLTLPVRTYSAGMMTRLGFALVTALKPDVLLMDEGVGAGDLSFTERAAERMDDFMGRSRIMVLASHSDSMIMSICNKAALMQEGRMLTMGPVKDVLDEYHFLVHGSKSTKANASTGDTDEKPAEEAFTAPEEPSGPVYSEESIQDVGLEDRLKRTNGAVRFTRAVARDVNGQTRWSYLPGETVTFRFEYEVFEPVPDLELQFRLYIDASERAPIQVLTEIFEVLSVERIESGHRGKVEITLPQLKLQPNQISIFAYLGSTDDKLGYDVIDTNIAFPPLVIRAQGPEKLRRGIVALEHAVKGFGPDN